MGELKQNHKLSQTFPKPVKAEQIRELKNYTQTLEYQIWTLWRLARWTKTKDSNQQLKLEQIMGQLANLAIQLRYYKVAEDTKKFTTVAALDYSSRMRIFNNCLVQFEEITTMAQKLKILDLTFLAKSSLKQEPNSDFLVQLQKEEKVAAQTLAANFYQFIKNYPRPKLDRFE